MLVVGGGSAKDELSARVGILVGNFIKRFLTILWTLTGLIALALYANEIADPDLVWGHATLDLLGPLGVGLVGLMITALMAALMSSASCYILVASSLLVRNLTVGCILRRVRDIMCLSEGFPARLQLRGEYSFRYTTMMFSISLSCLGVAGYFRGNSLGGDVLEKGQYNSRLGDNCCQRGAILYYSHYVTGL